MIVSFSDIIKEIKEKNDLTTKQLAAALNIKKQTVSDWENHVSIPGPNMLRKIANMYSIPVERVLDCHKNWLSIALIPLAHKNLTQGIISFFTTLMSIIIIIVFSFQEKFKFYNLLFILIAIFCLVIAVHILLLPDILLKHNQFGINIAQPFGITFFVKYEEIIKVSDLAIRFKSKYFSLGLLIIKTSDKTFYVRAVRRLKFLKIDIETLIERKKPNLPKPIRDSDLVDDNQTTTNNTIKNKWKKRIKPQAIDNSSLSEENQTATGNVTKTKRKKHSKLESFDNLDTPTEEQKISDDIVQASDSDLSNEESISTDNIVSVSSDMTEVQEMSESLLDSDSMKDKTHE